MISLLIFIAAIMGIAFTLVRGPMAIVSRKRYDLPLKESSKLSWPAKQILRDYKSLPEESRPSGNMVRMVKALDTHYGVSKANSHFMVSGFETSHNSWNCRDKYQGCSFKDYREIHQGIKEIKAARTAQEVALARAGVSGEIESARDVVEQMRQEAKLINTITKELT